MTEKNCSPKSHPRRKKSKDRILGAGWGWGEGEDQERQSRKKRRGRTGKIGNEEETGKKK